MWISSEKDRELGAAVSEIKALKASEVLKDKALEEVLSTQLDLLFLHTFAYYSLAIISFGNEIPIFHSSEMNFKDWKESWKLVKM